MTQLQLAPRRQDGEGTLYYVLDYTERAVAPGSGNWFRHNLSVYAARCARRLRCAPLASSATGSTCVCEGGDIAMRSNSAETVYAAHLSNGQAMQSVTQVGPYNMHTYVSGPQFQWLVQGRAAVHIQRAVPASALAGAAGEAAGGSRQLHSA